MKSASGAVAKFILFDLLGSIAWFPLWWYTRGFRDVFATLLRILKYRARAYGFGIWIRNFFVPMYGQHDLAGRLISVLMRTVVLIGRTFAIILEALVYLLGLLLWLAAPFLIILFIVTNLFANIRL